MKKTFGYALAATIFIELVGAAFGISVRGLGYSFLFITLLLFLSAFKYLPLRRSVQVSENSKALVSHQILEIANETLPYLRTGLNPESAFAVAQIIWKQTDAIAVAITDCESVLAFRGVGEGHHEVGKPILTLATTQTLAHSSVNVVESKEDIGCPVPNCPLRAAIVVPLESLGKPSGTLKFYYDSRDKLTQSHITVATGVGRLLSTQLELSEIDKQSKLATQARIKALQAQINPHFLFNTLNTIAMFCRTKPDEARRLLVEFADFFRCSLERENEFVSVNEELDYVNSYLVFEKARFGDSLQVIENIDPKAMELMLPILTLQPLVENAVKHGAAPDRALSIMVSVKLNKGDLKITVKDNGEGIDEAELPHIFEPGFGKGTGVGLNNVKERLTSIYGQRSELIISSKTGEGTTVKMSIPALKQEIGQVAHEA